MTATNHFVTGAVIASTISSAVVAFPLALLSHLILDIAPHYGFPGLSLASRKFQIILLCDTTLLVLFTLFLVLTRPDNWIMILVSGFIAFSPDLLHIPSWLSAKQGKTHIYGKINQFLHDIQRYERPWGIYVEIFWFALMLLIFININYT